MSVFDDQAMFMRACGQTVGGKNKEQFELYKKLIGEEVNEFYEACDKGNVPEMFDALIDIMVVAIGAGHSAGFPMEDGWDAVQISNLRKINPETGRVEKREDGKILKPIGWRGPNLQRILENHGWQVKA